MEFKKRVNNFLTYVVLQLFNSFKGAFQNRIYGLDFGLNWYHIIAFILFVIRVSHRDLDDELRLKFFKEIDFYIDDSKNEGSYLNYFGSENFKRGVTNHETELMVNNSHALISKYIGAWNNSLNYRPDIAASKEFVNHFKTDDDNRAMTLAFDFVFKKYKDYKEDGDAVLFD